MASQRAASDSHPCSSGPFPLTARAYSVSPPFLQKARTSRDIQVKADIHPNYDFMTVTMTDGSTYVTRSTMGKEGAKLSLDIDPRVHPAWTGGTGAMLDRGGRVSRFNDKFGSFMKK